MTRRKAYSILASIAIFIVFLNVLFYFFNPDRIVSWVGVENTYIIIFTIATIGGLSSLTGTALFASIATFVAGGASLFLIALVAGAGIFISDTIFYFLASYGRKSAPKDWEDSLQEIQSRIEKYPPWLVLTGMYIYIGFTPLPNDLLMVALVLGGYTYKKIVWVLLAGSFSIALVTAYLGYILFI